MLHCIRLCSLVQSLCPTQLCVPRLTEQSAALTTHLTQIVQYKYTYMNRQKFSMLNIRIAFVRANTSSNYMKQHYTNVPVTMRKKNLG